MRFFPKAFPPTQRPATPAAILALAACLCPACGNGTTASGDANGNGQFGQPAVLDSGVADGGTLDGDEASADPSGPTVGLRVLHGIPNVGPVVLCRFKALTLDDPSTSALELDLTNDTGELVADSGPLAEGLSFGEVSPWVRLGVADTGVLTLHRAPLPDPRDAGLPNDAGLVSDAGATDANAAGDATVAPVRPCDPATLEVALPLPLPDAWLTPPAPPPMTTSLDASVQDAGLSLDDAGLDAALPTLVEQFAARGIASSLTGTSSVTLFASGLAFSREAVAKTLSNDGAAQIRAADLAFGPRLLASERPVTPPGASFSLSLAHLVPDVFAAGSSGSAPASLRACITVDGVEGRAVPAASASPVAFREHVSLASELASSSRYRIRVFAADDVSAPGQDCANTTRAPLAQIDAKAADFSAGMPYTLVVIGLTAPEALCSAPTASGVVRPGCFGSGDHSVRLSVLQD